MVPTQSRPRAALAAGLCLSALLTGAGPLGAQDLAAAPPKEQPAPEAPKVEPAKDIVIKPVDVAPEIGRAHV